MLSLETIAYEEAGHAVAASVLGVPFVDVTITPLKGSVRPVGEKKRLEERYLIVSLAVPAARRRYDPDSAYMDEQPGSDTVLVRGVIPSYQEITGSWDGFEDVKVKAQKLIDAHWLEVERVVQALLKDKTLSADAVRAAMVGSPQAV